MNALSKQIKQLLLVATLVLAFTATFAQGKKHPPAVKQIRHSLTTQLSEFNKLAAEASVTFNFPKGFKEIKAPNDEDFSFDYAMEMPGKAFEIWFQVKSEKENWASYERSQNTPNAQTANPDSSYMQMGKAHASAFTGDNKSFVKNIPPEILARYNANAGKSYLLNLRDTPATKHYKYALLIVLQKDHTGMIMAVCFTNNKDPEFYKNIDKASNCLKFKV